jgi:RimJ/RimL family protein N-acetyltransferase
MKIKPPRLESERLILRKFKSGDEKNLLEFKPKRIKDLKSAREFIKKSIGDNGFYLAIVLKKEKKVIGYRELDHLNWWGGTAGEIAAHINKKYRRNGYSTEAAMLLIDYCFNKLKFHKVYADADHDNFASQKGLKKLGFKREGISREKRKVKGKWIDEWNYGLLKPEWVAAKKKLAKDKKKWGKE